MSSSDASRRPRCRFCATELVHTFVDLGTSPPCQSQVSPNQLAAPETFYPLHVRVCHECFLVQLEEVVPPEEIFHAGDYAYFSSYSTSWLAHAERFAQAMIPRLGLTEDSRVVEVASNDGYLLQYFKARGIPVQGVDPASNCAAAARDKGIDTVVDFFGEEVARTIRERSGAANLIVGNNVLAHVPDVNDLIAGVAALLAEGGTASFEFPHLARLVEGNQFDTIYHEHYSYLGFHTVERMFAAHGLTIIDVAELPTHGGSLRVFARHSSEENRPVLSTVVDLKARERELGMLDLAYYRGFGDRVARTKRGLLAFLIEARNAGQTVVGYGAPGKGNTLLNYCGIRSDLLQYTVDRSPHKQGNYTPGMRIPIHPPERIFETEPDFVLILPWNLQSEIVDQMRGISAWGGRFVVPIPEVRVLEEVTA